MSSLWIVCGRVNYTNLSRYSPLCERTYRRHFQHGLALEAVNQRLIEHSGSETGKQIAVVDCTFVEKIGTHTPGLAWFYNSKSGRVEKGLEWAQTQVRGQGGLASATTSTCNRR